MATKPCTLGPKHTWEFVKNASKATVTFAAGGGSHGRFSLVGIYKCACGATRNGRVKNDAPGADLRDHLNINLGG